MRVGGRFLGCVYLHHLRANFRAQYVSQLHLDEALFALFPLCVCLFQLVFSLIHLCPPPPAALCSLQPLASKHAETFRPKLRQKMGGGDFFFFFFLFFVLRVASVGAADSCEKLWMLDGAKEWCL